MYAIVDIAGQQFKVEKDQKLYVHRLEVEEGKKVNFDRVLLLDTGNKVSVGDPLVKGASVDAKVISHLKGDKVLVFKKKRRKGYKKLNGHRQYLTEIQIEGISEKASAPKKEAPAAKKEEAPKAAAEKKPAAAKKPAAEKKPAAKATTDKKPAAKASETKKPAAKTTAGKTAAAKKPAAKKPAAKAAPKKESGDKAE